ncbi:hypothetical protein BDZ89DRAFT_1234581 [Hymenopellis radicata]|nr:hypothetical protein BDZ89DRAFT_1234581 [Hymenopellis radicata]
MSLDIEKWIGKGKKYRAAPLHVMDAFAAEVTMPPTLAQLLPAQEMPVPEFIALNFPLQSHSLITHPPEQWFSRETPSRTLTAEMLYDIISRRTIPPEEHLDANPSCVLSFWRTLSRIVQKQEDWKEAHHFVSIEVSKLNISQVIMKTCRWSEAPIKLSCRRGCSRPKSTSEAVIPVLFANHEVVLCVDFGKQTISYGDSIRGFSPPKEVLRDTQKWLKARFKGPFTELGNAYCGKGDAAKDAGRDAEQLCLRYRQKTRRTSPVMNTAFGDVMQFMHLEVEEEFSMEAEESGNLADETMRGGGGGLWLYVQSPHVVTSKKYRRHSVPIRVQRTSIHVIMFFRLFTMLPPSKTMDDEARRSGGDRVPCGVSQNGSMHEKMEDESGNTHTMDVDDSPPYERSSSSTRAPSPNTAANPPKHSQKDAWASLFAQKKSTATTTSKRKRDNTGESKNAKKPRGRSPSPQRGGPTGLSKAAKSEAASRKAADEGVVDAVKREKWKRKILSIDAHAEFDEQNLRAVRCSIATRLNRRTTSAKDAAHNADGSHYTSFAPRMGQAGTPYARSVPALSSHAAASQTPTSSFDMLLKRDTRGRRHFLSVLRLGQPHYPQFIGYSESEKLFVASFSVSTLITPNTTSFAVANAESSAARGSSSQLRMPAGKSRDDISLVTLAMRGRGRAERRAEGSALHDAESAEEGKEPQYFWTVRMEEVEKARWSNPVDTKLVYLLQPPVTSLAC